MHYRYFGPEYLSHLENSEEKTNCTSRFLDFMLNRKSTEDSLMGKPNMRIAIVC